MQACTDSACSAGPGAAGAAPVLGAGPGGQQSKAGRREHALARQGGRLCGEPGLRFLEEGGLG